MQPNYFNIRHPLINRTNTQNVFLIAVNTYKQCKADNSNLVSEVILFIRIIKREGFEIKLH